MWSYLLTGIGATTLYLAGKKVWWCWYISLANQLLWLIYALTTKQYGFIFSVIIYTYIFGKNAISWTKDKPIQAIEKELA